MLGASATAADVEAERVDAMEVRMIAEHSKMVTDLASKNKEVDAFERRTAQYRADVREYDEALRRHHNQMLDAMGELAFETLQRQSAAAGIESSGPQGVSRTDLDLARAIVPNTIGAGRPCGRPNGFAVLLSGLIAPQEADELIRVSEALGFRQIVKNISDNYDQVTEISHISN